MNQYPVLMVATQPANMAAIPIKLPNRIPDQRPKRNGSDQWVEWSWSEEVAVKWKGAVENQELHLAISLTKT